MAMKMKKKKKTFKKKKKFQPANRHQTRDLTQSRSNFAGKTRTKVISRNKTKHANFN